ncbi:MAG: hypothetical protein QOK40_3164 [Miltoncostaeaceae bacterium]|nr:hypothetical protein [Miltoncostaeaceae bacterium]
MRARLLASSVLIALAAVIILGVPLGLVGTRLVRSDATTSLQREAQAVAGAIEDDLEVGRALPLARVRRLLSTGHTFTVTDRRGTVLVGSRPADDHMSASAAAAKGAVVSVSAPTGEVDERVAHLWLVIGLLAVGGIVAALSLGLLQGRRFARPLERLAETSARLGAGDFTARAGRQVLPEMDALAVALDRSAERIAELVQRERAFSANVSHQLRTPLTAIRLRLEELADAPDAAVRQEARAALEQSERLERTVEDLLALARHGRAGAVAPIDAASLLRQRVSAWLPTYRRQRRALEARAGGTSLALGARGALEQALDVLLENALRHGGGTVVAEARRVDGHLILSVSDAGAGVAPNAEAAIFEQRPTGGIGLPLARALIEAGGGRLRLARPRPARFEVILPAPPVESGTPPPGERA